MNTALMWSVDHLPSNGRVKLGSSLTPEGIQGCSCARSVNQSYEEGVTEVTPSTYYCTSLLCHCLSHCT